MELIIVMFCIAVLVLGSIVGPFLGNTSIDYCLTDPENEES